MPALSRTLSATRRDQLCRIRSFLGYETARQYFDKKGRRRCVCSSISHDLSVFLNFFSPILRLEGGIYTAHKFIPVALAWKSCSQEYIRGSLTFSFEYPLYQKTYVYIPMYLFQLYDWAIGTLFSCLTKMLQPTHPCRPWGWTSGSWTSRSSSATSRMWGDGHGVWGRW